MLRIAPTALTAACLTALLFGGCGGDGTSDLFGPGSKTGSGGLGEPVPTTGGSSHTGGRATGGSAAGGRAATGGSDDGGSDDGGSASGGKEAGGSSSGGRSATGGKASGGASAGGKANGGAPNGGSGGSATGGVPTGGSGGATGGSKSTGGATACSDTDGSDVRVQGTSKGLNGSFTDECENGELIEYYCETLTVVDPSCLASSPNGGAADLAAPRPIPTCEVYTGQVVSSQIDCDGLCKDGTCMYWCPTVEQEVEYHETGSGTAVLHNNDLDFVYDCQVTWERDGYDCSDANLVGSFVGVYSLGACTLDNIVFGTDTPEEPGIQHCTFDCTLID